MNSNGHDEDEETEALQKADEPAEKQEDNPEQLACLGERGEQLLDLAVTSWRDNRNRFFQISKFLDIVKRRLKLTEKEERKTIWDPERYEKGFAEYIHYNALLLGDETTEAFDVASGRYIWNFKKVCEKGCTITRAQEMLDRQMSPQIKAVLIQAFKHEFTSVEDGGYRVHRDKLNVQ